MTPSVDYAEPEPPPPPIIEEVAAPKATGPVNSPWERLDAQRTEIETVKPPDELVRPAGPPGIICPACRTENEASRRFCQSCGTPLVVTAPVQEMAPRPARRSFRWVLILIPIVIVAGLLGFGGAAFFKGLAGPSPTVGPTGSQVATASGATPSVSLPSGSVGPSAHLLTLHSIVGSGKLDQAHSTGKSIDADGPTTSWQDDTKAGRDIWIEVTFAGKGIVDLSSITIFPGDQKNATAFKQVARPHHIQLKADSGAPVTITLADQFGSQDFAVSLHVTKTLRVTIVDTYAGDTSTFSGISEIRFIGTAAP